MGTGKIPDDVKEVTKEQQSQSGDKPDTNDQFDQAGKTAEKDAGQTTDSEPAKGD